MEMSFLAQPGTQYSGRLLLGVATGITTNDWTLWIAFMNQGILIYQNP